MADGRGKYEVTSGGDNESEGGGGFLNFLYDSRSGRILGRTCDSWAKITVFYIIYYTCLAAFFVGMISVFLFGVIVEDKPHRTGQHSLLKMNPGLGYRPQPDSFYTLVSFTAGKNNTYSSYIAQLTKVYNEYQREVSVANKRSGCSPNSAPDNEPNKVCQFNWSEALSGCTPISDFGFASGQPCIIVKLNKIFGWMPDPIDENVPHPLVECHGENAADKATIGDITYYPSTDSLNISSSSLQQPMGYFSQVYYPYLNQPEYMQPLVAVRFDSIMKNTLVMVECRVHNLRGSQYSKVDREAMVRFELFVRTK